MFQKIKGTRDFNVFEKMSKKVFLSEITSLFNQYGFNEIETPTLEYTELYRRSVEQSDIAKKEMYEFLDKSGREICLKPEGTASFARAYVENKWFADNVFNKFYYVGDMFRYEQPQKGRYRQFLQLGVEYVTEKNYLADAEVIILALKSALIFNKLQKKGVIQNLNNTKCVLKLNTIGDFASRNLYEQKLYEFLIPFKDKLSQNSKDRLESHKVLRILDDKIDSKLDFIKNAPKLKDYLSEESNKYFENVYKIVLNEINKLNLNVEIEISNELVRGLDYYDETVFEISLFDKNENEYVVAGGGRYSNLISELGGPATSSVGFGFGLDRYVSWYYENTILEQNDEIFKNTAFYDYYLVTTINDQNQLDTLFDLYNELVENTNLRIYFENTLVKDKKILNRANKIYAKNIISFDKLKNSFVIYKTNDFRNKQYLEKNTYEEILKNTKN